MLADRAQNPAQDREPPREVFWLETHEHLELLADATRQEIIELLGTPASVAQLAEKMGVPRTRLYHHVNLLEGGGMIRVVDTRLAGVQTEKIFQVAAVNFRPSPEFMRTALPRDQAKAILQSILGSTQADFVRSVESGRAALADGTGQRRTHLSRRLLRLYPAQLQTFIEELEALLHRYDREPPASAESRLELETVAVLSLVYPSARDIQ